MTEREIIEFIFLDNFFSAMVVPFKTEYGYKIILWFGGHNNYILAAVAAIGSTAGGCVGWLTGRVIAMIEKSKYLKLPENQLAEAVQLFNSKLLIVLLFTWVDIIGNPITVIAGFLKTKFKVFVGLTALGNFAYYYALIYLIR